MDIFCKIVKGDIPSKRIYEDELVIVILDVNPSSNGHSLIIPKKHFENLFDIEDELLDHIMKVARDVANLLEDKLGCEGITLIQNNKLEQDVKHFHLHLVPKYSNSNKLGVEEVFHKIVD